MKVWYDRKAKSRCFEPGDRVLVLFPVVGNPLQAKYSGPYKVVKKISDTNYLVKTPDRRKETQVCHINMLKAYHEKPKPELVTLNNRLGLESPTHSKDIVGQGRVRPLDAKIQTIAKFPIPTSRKELARFLAMAGYYRSFCLNFSDIAAPLTNLLSKKVKFVWTDDCQLAFDKVKLLLQKSPVLKSPDYEKPFKLIIDSSDVGTGSVLVQEASDGLDHPVSYFSKKFLKYQKNYSVVEKETLGLVLALEHFDVYLGSTPFKIKVYTDHNPLTFLKTMKNKNQRLVRWSLALQEYNLEIQHIPGSENVVADALSRCIG